MSFRKFVINNVMRNKRLYAAYFLSSMFVVTIFFTFAMFAFHPAFEAGKVNSDALFGMSVAGGIIYIFSFFFVLYSMSSFLQSRKKEFGLLMLQGMSIRQIRFMVFLENMLIGVFAIIVGIGVGTLFAKFILLIAENILVIEESLSFYLPVEAIVLTLLSFILLFLFISFFVTFILSSKKLAELIKANKQPKTEPKASILLTIFALLLLGAGYITALLAKGPTVIFVMIPVIIVVIIGTYFLFTQLSVFLIHFLKNRKSVFWKKTNMVLLSDLSFRMKDNARTFFMVAIISTVAFSAIGTLFGFQTYLTSGVKDANPFSFTYLEDEDSGSQAEKNITLINEQLKERNIKANEVTTELRYYETESGNEVQIANESMYNEFANALGKDNIHLNQNDVIGVTDSDAVMGGYGLDILNDEPLAFKDEDQYIMKEMENDHVLPGLLGYFIVSDDTYDALPDPTETENYTAWKADKGQQDKLIQAGETLSNEIGPPYFQANDLSIYEINKAFGPILFIGLFIGIVFFVSAGSFLYFRLFMDLDDDKRKFKSIAKIGLTDKELKKIITSQTAILFFAPIVVALIHGAVALTALSNFFDYNLVKESAIVLGCFFLIQVIYFIIVRLVYIRQLKRSL